MIRFARGILGALLGAAIASCGGGGGGGGNPIDGTGGTGGDKGSATVVELDVSPLQMVVGLRQEKKIEVVARSADGEPVEVPVFFRSADPEVALVAGDGTVTGRAKGQTRIEIEAARLGAVVAVKVEGEPVRIDAPESVSIALGRTFPLDAVVLDADGDVVSTTPIEWTSEDPTVAVVEGGEVVARGWGETRLIANAGELEAEVRVRTLLRFAEIGTGEFHTCGLTPTGTVYCWGLATEGRLGFETEQINLHTPSLPVAGGTRFVELAVGSDHACALDEKGRAHCWGRNDAGQLGAAEPSYAETPRMVPGLIGLRSLAARGSQTCALDEEGAARCWGGFHGTEPARVDAGPFVQLAVGAFHVCGLTEEGMALCWGENGVGQLGRTEPDVSAEPLEVEGIPALAAIVAGYDHVCGIAADESALYCWGANDRGQLGRGSVGKRGEPEALLEGTPVDSLGLGRGTSCVISPAGAYCWGANESSQLGSHATEEIVTAPTRVVSGPWRFVLIRPGTRHTCALTDQREAYCWGNNAAGQLGSPACDDESEICAHPEQVLGQR